jgi:predicted metal-dependent phosphoesterase TrpH
MKADLHVHTNFSYDGISSPEEVVQAALDKGIGCICITDHEELGGIKRALRFAFGKDILIIPGIEVSSRSGHILGINIKRKIPAGLSASETVKEIKKQGGIAIAAHPFDIYPFGFRGGEEAIRKIDFDAIEVFNAGRILRNCHDKALKLASQQSFPITAGSDAHRSSYVGRGYLEFDQEIGSSRDLVKLIEEKGGMPGGKALNLAEVLWNSARARIF